MHIDILRDPITGKRPHLENWVGYRLVWENEKGHQMTFAPERKRGDATYPTKEEAIMAWNTHASYLNSLLSEPKNLT